MSEARFTEQCVAELEMLIERECVDTIAAFIAEPMNGTAGIVPPPDGYWPAVQALLKRHDILLIADEVLCGFGRLGARTGCKRFGIALDPLTYAKGLTSGYAPLSAVVVGDTKIHIRIVGRLPAGAGVVTRLRFGAGGQQSLTVSLFRAAERLETQTKATLFSSRFRFEDADIAGILLNITRVPDASTLAE